METSPELGRHLTALVDPADWTGVLDQGEQGEWRCARAGTRSCTITEAPEMCFHAEPTITVTLGHWAANHLAAAAAPELPMLRDKQTLLSSHSSSNV